MSKPRNCLRHRPAAHTNTDGNNIRQPTMKLSALSDPVVMHVYERMLTKAQRNNAPRGPKPVTLRKFSWDT